ncbi:MFS transporter [Phytomonospora sp. NPDC050363]|uniref:MFS transporter n=1 Tax=Phytomonospora sp. NPDC050363 TaxID=3155642 RepID=UPI0033F7FFDE
MTGPTETTSAPAYGHSSRRERTGWYIYDWANSAFSTTVVTAFLGPYLTNIAKAADDVTGTDTVGQISLIGLNFRADSLWAFTTALSVILQVLVLPVAGAIADRTPRKKQLLAAFAYTGAAATCALVFLTGDRWELGAVLFIIANVSFGASVVVYNSFLPQISTEEERDAVSSRGWAFGYLGGGTLLLLNVIAVLVGGDDMLAETARYSIVSAGLWWAGFTTITMARLQNRPALAGQAQGSVLTDGFKQFFRTLKSLRAYPKTLAFLIAFLIFNDGIQTVIAMAGTYGQEELGFENDILMPTILVVQFVAFGGALALGRLARRYGAWKTVLGSLVAWVFILIAAFFLPYANAPLFVAVGAGIGFVLGGSQALSRSLFSQLIPKGREGEYFGLYEISDKGTSWLGPIVFAVTNEITGSNRLAIISLVIFFVVGFVLLIRVPMAEAIRAAGNTPPEKL